MYLELPSTFLYLPVQPEHLVVVEVIAFVISSAMAVRASSRATRAAGVSVAGFALPGRGTPPPFRPRRQPVARPSRWSAAVLAWISYGSKKMYRKLIIQSCPAEGVFPGLRFPLMETYNQEICDQPSPA